MFLSPLLKIPGLQSPNQLSVEIFASLWCDSVNVFSSSKNRVNQWIVDDEGSYLIWQKPSSIQENLSFLMTQSQAMPQFFIMSFWNTGLDIQVHIKLTKLFGF